MAHYLPSTDAQRREMLDAIGCDSASALYSAVPQLLLQTDGPDIPDGLAELAVMRKMSALAEKNTVFRASFRGAGAYRHYIPALVDAVTSKETFVTAYTPYQAEMSQGILQSIFEYQTMIAELTGLDSSNASVYDGATAAAEAAAMCRDRKRGVTLVSAAAHPEVIQTLKTYCWATNNELRVIPVRDGVTDLDELRKALTGDVSGVYLMQPNYFGLIEDCETAAEIIHAGGAKFIMGVNPIAAAILKSPGECGADIAVGEGQPLGMPLSFGGPYLGFMAATDALTRKLPGRIVGQTTDAEGRRAFVLTLQAREQHIRREKAGSNICSNQALCAMTAAVYLAAMGPRGIKEVAEQCFSKAHYLARELEKCGFTRRHGGEFFHEFLTECPVDAVKLEEHLAQHGILAGAPVNGGILWCATEMNTKEEIDRLIAVIKEMTA
jgi:glycine dehydrogenase subunit 1